LDQFDWKSKPNGPLPSGCNNYSATEKKIVILDIVILDIGEPKRKCDRPDDTATDCSGVAHVRAFLPGGPVELWTDEANIYPDTPRVAAEMARESMLQAADAKAAGDLDEAEIDTKMAEAYTADKYKAGNTEDVDKLVTARQALTEKESAEYLAKEAEDAKPPDDSHPAKHLKGDYVACVSSELLDQITTAMVNKDERGKEYLLNNHGCIFPKGGADISVLDEDWLVAHVRAYGPNGDTVELFTPRENLAR